MAISEQEELELLQLERDRAMATRSSPAQADVRKVDNAAQHYTPPPTLGRMAADAAVSGLRMGGPAAIPLGFLNAGAEQLDKLLGEQAYQAGGAVTDVTGSPVAGQAVNVGIQAIPAVLGGGVAGKVAKPAMESTGKWLMGTAVKPSVADRLSGDADKAIKTLLDEGINVTPGGMAEIRRRVSTLNDEVKEIIKDSKGLVNKTEIGNSVERALNKFRYSTINREANLASINKARDEFFAAVDDLEPLAKFTGHMPVQLAQKIKQATQRTISDSFGELSGAQMEAGKDLTYALRKGIEKLEPAVAAPNAKQSELLNALSVSERHALQALNKNPASVSLLAENPAAATAFMADRSELFKSILARMLYSGRERIPQAVGGSAAAVYEGVHNRQQ